jgi:hypothetical protein
MFRHDRESSCFLRPSHRDAAQGDRRALTLLELLLAMSIMVLIAGALGALAKTVELNSEYAEGHGQATQHARVALERITRNVNEATANELFPGFRMVYTHGGTWKFPDTLVVWHPARTATNPQGLPRQPKGLPCFDELVIYCPNPQAPNQLMEITLPGDVRPAYAAKELAAWETELEAIKVSAAAKKVVLTELLRVGTSADLGSGQRLGMVRFVSRLRPSKTEWEQYQKEQRKWEDLSWAQGLRGVQSGLRQAWLRIELQLMPGAEAATSDPSGQQAIPFFGSAAMYYSLERKSP